MKKTLLSAVMIASFGIAALVSQTAQALPDGTITFTGKVVANTCAFKVNGGSASNTVVLPVVFITALGAAGNVAGNTTFTIAASGCDTNLASVQAYFNGANVDGTTGNLKNTGPGAATNVQVQLLNGTTSTVMPLNAANATAQNSPVGTLSLGAATMNYSAQYIAVGGAATAGLVNTSVAYTINYL